MAVATGPQLGELLRGSLIEPDDAEYDDARRVFNASIDRRPAAIARCSDVADVMAAVNHAREAGLLLSVRGGGHNVAGFSTNDDGLVIDLARMRGIRVDPVRRTVRAEGGTTWGDLDHATHAFGLATPGGAVSTTGIAGLTLGGGIGHLTRPFGLACDNLLAADVVTADGRLVVASEDENPDLLWALRGGGGNFGVVTSFEFRLHPVDTVYAGPILWSLDKAADVMRFYRDFMATAPDELNALFAFIVVEPAAPLPEHLHGRNMCAVVVNHVGRIEDAERVVRPLVEFAQPDLVGLGPMPYPVLQTAFDSVSLPGMHQYWKADFVDRLTDDMIAVHTERGPGVPNPFSGMVLFPVSGAAHRPGRNDTAWSYRDADFVHIVYAADPDAAAIEPQTTWVRDYWEALHPLSAGGAYLNFLHDEGDARVTAAYRDNYPRLADVKRTYDPNNLFRMNQNIKPAG